MNLFFKKKESLESFYSIYEVLFTFTRGLLIDSLILFNFIRVIKYKNKNESKIICMLYIFSPGVVLIECLYSQIRIEARVATPAILGESETLIMACQITNIGHRR